VADVGWSNYLMCGRLAVSPGGLLVYQPGTGENGDTELVTVDRTGRELSVVGSLAEYYSPMLSHNGRQIAVDITDVQVTQGDVWVFDIERGTRTRLAGTELDESAPVWSPDDGELYYRRVPDLFVRDVAGAKPARPVIESGVSKKPEDISPDGRLLIFEVDSGNDADLWVLDLETGEATPWLDAPYREHQGRFSPDGRWVAYESEESGDRQVYLRSFPDGDRRLVVSTEGGGTPVWRADGDELFYYSAGSEIVAVPVTWTENGPRLGASEPLFRVRLREADSAFDVYPDGERFLLNRVVTEKDVVSLVLVQNVFASEKPR
jgi:Tol biopolymer transport system component